MTSSLGLRANRAQIALLALVNVFVGAMVGVERSVLPLVGERDFGLASRVAIVSFVASFGAAKAFANLAAGRLADRRGRRPVLLAGWLLALPVPVLLALAPSWSVIVLANVLLGASQGLAWSMTIVMKVDLAGPARRGLVLGVNEAAGYCGVALAAALAGFAAAAAAPRTVVWVGGAAIAVAGVVLSLATRETGARVEVPHAEPPRRTTSFAACAQAGFVNNLNDAVAWGIVPLYLAAHGASAAEIGVVAGLYPAVWGVGQLAAGALSDRFGRRPFVAGGMAAQAVALWLLAAAQGGFAASLGAAALLGAGTAAAYPVLVAAVADAAAPRARARAIGRYRFWRDSGLVAGALAGGLVADAAGAGPAVAAAGVVTALSAVWFVLAGEAATTAGRGRRRRRRSRRASPAGSASA